jgi:hypothetical protein
MAALRRRKVRLATPQTLRNLFAKKYRKKKRKAGVGRPPVGTRNKTFSEIVATTPEEAASGKFKPVGNLFIFIPSEAERFLWNRLDNLTDPRNLEELWFRKDWGIYPYLRTLRDHPQGSKLTIKKLRPDQLMMYRIKRPIPPVQDPSTGQMIQSELPFEEYYPYRDIVRKKWIPKVLYGSETAQQGLFGSVNIAKRVAKAFDINLNTTAPTSSWYVSDAPAVREHAIRGYHFDKDQYEIAKSAVLETLRNAFQSGVINRPDWKSNEIRYWSSIEKRLIEVAGPKAQSILERLKHQYNLEKQRLMQS